jgi:hypothetical protein
MVSNVTAVPETIGTSGTIGTAGTSLTLNIEL